MIKMTITTDIQGTDKGYSGVKKHNEHDPSIKNPSNKDILSTYTHYNTLKNGRKYAKKITDWQEQQFGDWLEEHNAQLREKGHAERQIDGVKRWLKNKTKYAGVLTFGSMESTNELMKLLVPADALETRKTEDGQDRVFIKLDHPKEGKRFYGMYRQAFEQYLKAMEDNKITHNHMVIGRHAMHFDELGAPHLHYEIAYAGKTAKGRPTPSVDAALKSYWKDSHPDAKRCPSSKAVWSWYRGVMDGTAAHCLADAIKAVYGKEGVIKPVRKSKDDPTVITGLTMEQVKAIHAERAKVQAQIKADKAEAKKALYDQMSATRRELERANQLHAQNEQLNKTIQDKQNRVEALDDRISAKTETVKELDGTIKAKQDQVSAKTTEVSALDKTIKHHKKQKTELESEITGLTEQKRTADQALKNAQTHHQTVMVGLDEEEEATQARHDKLLAETSALEQRKTQLQADVTQYQSFFDQVTDNLIAWLDKHLNKLINLGLNAELGKYWLKERGGDDESANQYQDDRFDDVERLAAGDKIPVRYVHDKEFKHWTRLSYQRKQRNLRERAERTRSESTDHDGPEL